MIDSNMKYKNVTFEECGTDKFPTMVKVIKTNSKMKELLNKKFVTREKLIVAVDAYSADEVIKRGGENVPTELEELFGINL